MDKDDDIKLSISTIAIAMANKDASTPPSPVAVPMPVDDFYESGNKLCQDELSAILQNSCIKTSDLLNFRLVNKIWRDAATEILLKRKSCCISLTQIQVSQLMGGELLLFCKHGNTKMFLKQLSKLICNSSKFPSSTLHLQYYSESRISELTDLPGFFELHGKMIQCIRFDGPVSKENLLDIFFNYTPNLESLDLNRAVFDCGTQQVRRIQENEKNEIGTIPIKVLHAGFDFDKKNEVHREIMKLLLVSSSKLSCIENVQTLSTLFGIISYGKSHLIKSLHYYLYNVFNYDAMNDDPSSISLSLLDEIKKLSPGLPLTRLNLDVPIAAIIPPRGLYKFPLVSAALNLILESCKKTLQQLEVTVNPTYSQTNLSIPPMENLKCFKLKEIHDYVRPVPINPRNASESYVVRFKGDNLSCHNYFPNLFKVSFDCTESPFNSLIKFNLNEENDLPSAASVWSWETVQVLEIVNPAWLNSSKSSSVLLSRCFPNIRVLKLKCRDVLAGLRNFLWVMCPLVEFIEFYGITSCFGERDNIGVVDQFFTGFSLDMCKKLRDTEIPKSLDTPDLLPFLRMMPSMCDALRLKELKLKFSKLSGPFASRVTGIYAFQKMPAVRIILSYHPPTLNCTDDEDADAYFATILPYVQEVLHEKQ